MSGSAKRVSATADVLAAERPRRARGAGRPRSERALIRGAKAGSERDLEELFRRHWRRAYRAAFLIVHDHAAAEDIAQEAFVAAIRTLDRFDQRRQFSPWLGRIVANRAIDWTRSRAARRENGPELPRGESPQRQQSGGYSPDVLEVLASLSPEHRAVVVLRYVLEYTPGEIAHALDLPRGTVNSRLRRALDILDIKLQDSELR